MLKRRLSLRGPVATGLLIIGLVASSAGVASAGAPKVSGAVKHSVTVALTRPTNIGLTTPLPSKPATGKNIYFVQCPVPECALIGQYLKEGTAKLGWTLHTVIETAETPEAINAAWQNVADVSPAPDGVISNGAPPAAFAAPLAQLKSENVPVVEFAIPTPAGNGVSASFLSEAYIRTVAHLWAQFVTVDSGGKANVMFYTDPAYPILPPEEAALKAYLPTICPRCHLAVVESSAANPPSEITAYVAAHPSLTYVVIAIDDFFPGLYPALKAQGLQKQVKIIGNDPSPANVAAINAGQEYASIAYPTGEVTYRSLDFLARTFEGASTAPDVSAPFRNFMLTKAGLKGGVPKNGRFDIVRNYVAQYAKLWHLS